jgi:fumarylpyruvate hydrolase
MSPAYLFPPQQICSLPVRDTSLRFPVRRIFCVGRNYQAHAREMGDAIDKSAMKPFYFLKDATTLVESGATVAYPPATSNYHYEMELVVAIGRPGFQVSETEAGQLILGYAAGLDMTRRDLQGIARDQGRPWDLGKNFEYGAVCGEIVPASGARVLDAGNITLQLNGAQRQASDLSLMIWSISELIADLSRFYHLQPGDLIYTGTPEGVGAVRPGDRISGHIQGVGEITLNIGQPG